MSTITSRDGTSIGFDKVGQGPAIVAVRGRARDRGPGGADRRGRRLRLRCGQLLRRRPGPRSRPRRAVDPKLALYEPPLVVDDTRPAVPTDFVARLDDFVAAGDRCAAVDYFMTKVVGLPEELLGPMHEDPSFTAFESVAHTLAYEGRVVGDSLFGDPASLKRWSDLTVLTLVMDGELRTWFGAS